MKIAVIATVWRPFSHADVIVTRWIEPFVTDEQQGWTKPSSKIASLFLDQTPANDIGRKICASAGIPVFETIREALTLGGSQLAVDAILLIGEHGDYPVNEFGQKLYPRKRLFDGITAVFRECGRSVPVFNDKHLSWNFSDSCEMIDASREMDFPLFAGTSLTHCPLDPGPPLSPGEAVTAALSLYYGNPENYGFHSMEFVQSLVESRPGGESGIRAARTFEGSALLEAVTEGEIPLDLLKGALTRHGYPDTIETVSFLLDRTENLLAYQFDHCDGLRTTHVCLPVVVSKWVAAVRTANGVIRSCKVDLAGAEKFFSSFARLNVQVEKFFRTGIPPSPLMRTHLVAGALRTALQARKSGSAWTETPFLQLPYSLNP